MESNFDSKVDTLGLDVTRNYELAMLNKANHNALLLEIDKIKVDVATNKSGVSSNKSGVATNKSGISSLDSRVTILEGKENSRNDMDIGYWSLVKTTTATLIPSSSGSYTAKPPSGYPSGSSEGLCEVGKKVYTRTSTYDTSCNCSNETIKRYDTYKAYVCK